MTQRNKLLAVHSPKAPPSIMRDRKPDEDALRDPLSPQILVEVRELTLAAGAVEPLVGTLSIWNVEQGRKVSEDFAFHFNSNEILALLKMVRLASRRRVM